MSHQCVYLFSGHLDKLETRAYRLDLKVLVHTHINFIR